MITLFNLMVIRGMDKYYSLISVIVPIYNQGDFIEEVIESYQVALEKLGKPYELILVPNGCRDHTLDVCRRLIQKNSAFQLVEMKIREWGLTIKTAIGVSKGDLLCYVNSARNTGEDLFAVLSEALAHPGSVVQARRALRPNWVRRFASWVYNLECRLLFGFSCMDVNGKPKVFPRSLNISSLLSDDILFDLEFVLFVFQQNYRLIEVPIYQWRRHGGKSTTTLWNACHLYLGPFRLKNMQKINARTLRLQKP